MAMAPFIPGLETPWNFSLRGYVKDNAYALPLITELH
jgi:hypothetical protein